MLVVPFVSVVASVFVGPSSLVVPRVVAVVPVMLMRFVRSRDCPGGLWGLRVSVTAVLF
jgi:hypothetical protein